MGSKQVNLFCWNFSTVCIVLALSFDVGVFFRWGGFETIPEPQKSLSALWAAHFSRQLLDHVLLDLELGHLCSCFCMSWCFVEKNYQSESLAHWQEREVLCPVWCFFSPSLRQEVGSFAAALLFNPLFVSRENEPGLWHLPAFPSFPFCFMEFLVLYWKTDGPGVQL